MKCLTLLLAVAFAVPGVLAAQPQQTPLRQLRRITLSVAERTPTMEEVEQVLAAEGEEARRGVVRDITDALIGDDEFLGTVERWAIDYFRISQYKPRRNTGNNTFQPSPSGSLQQCDSAAVNVGVWVALQSTPAGEIDECEDPSLPIVDIAPWWAPATTLRVGGKAASSRERSRDGSVDCAQSTAVAGGALILMNEHPDCGCGPNLLYCSRRPHLSQNLRGGRPIGYELPPLDPSGVRRSALLEPGKLLREVVASDAPLTDVLTGNYTVVNQGLVHQYYRLGRLSGVHPEMDENVPWGDFADPEHWQRMTFASMNPHLLDSRDYHFDPRTDEGEPEGIPSAGILTTTAANHIFPRERVRAARWLETFACTDFVAAPPGTEFPPLTSDPYSGGSCVTCHNNQRLDAASIFFKRLHGGDGVRVAGVGFQSLRYLERQNFRFDRRILFQARSAMIPNTYMTPVSEEVVANNEDARLMDFLPAGESLFGQVSDGAGPIGPLGFAQLLIASGRFDRCAAERINERFGPVSLSAGADESRLRTLAARFVADGRNLRSFVRYLLLESDSASDGW